MGQRAAPWADRDRAPLRVEVQNHHFSDVVIYAIPNGQRRRLGTVGGLGSETLRLPPEFEASARGFRLAVHPIGSRASYTTENITAGRGDTVILTVAGTLRMSHWHIRN